MSGKSVRAFILLTSLLLLSNLALAENPPAVLSLVNGDYLSGEWQASDEPNKIRWQSDFATGAYEFPLSAVAQVNRGSESKLAKPAGDFSLELQGGDLLFGNVVGITEEWLTIETPSDYATSDRRHLKRTLNIRRSLVRRITRSSRQGDIVYQGPNGLKQWKVSDRTPVIDQPDNDANNNDAEEPQEKPGQSWKLVSGHLTTRGKWMSIYRDCNLPEQACIEIELAWDQKADFSLALGVKNDKKIIDQAFSFEVLNDALVVMRETDKQGDLAPLPMSVGSSGRVHCLLYLDQPEGRLIVTTPTGEELASLRVKEAAASYPGIHLLNRQGDVRLETIRITRWNGQAPVAKASEQTTLLLQDGSQLQGEISGFDTEKSEYVITPREQPESEPKEEPKEEDVDSEIDEADDESTNDEAKDEEPSEAETPKSEPVTIASNRIASIAFAIDDNTALDEPTTTQLRLTTLAGERVTGSLIRVAEGKLHLQSEALAEPLVVSLDQLRSATALQPTRQAEPAKLRGRVGRLQLAGSNKRGVLVSLDDKPDDGKPDDTNASCLGWQPRASLNARPLRNDISGKLVYRTPKKKPTPRPARNVRIQRPNLFGAILGAMTGAGAKAKTANSGSMVYLRSGDRFACRVKGISTEGMTFESDELSATQIRHEHIKAVELLTQGVDGRVTRERRERLLTLPRLQRANPPTHLLVSDVGDYLRCNLVRMDDQYVTIEVRLNEQKIPTSRVARIIWLDTPPLKKSDKQEQAEPPEDKNVENNKASANRLRVQAVRSDGVRLTFAPESIENEQLKGTSEVLADCQVSLRKIDSLILGDQIEQVAAELAYQRWKMQHATDPRDNPDGESGTDSAPAQSNLAGKDAPKVDLPWVEAGKIKKGKSFKIRDYRGKVLVLDFWASWCGPCMQAMPVIDGLAEEFAERDVQLVAINLQEAPKDIAATIDRLNINAKVALDRDGVAAQRYGVTGIPQTVVIDRDGKVFKVFVGGGPKFEAQLRETLEQATEKEAGKQQSP